MNDTLSKALRVLGSVDIDDINNAYRGARTLLSRVSSLTSDKRRGDSMVVAAASFLAGAVAGAAVTAVVTPMSGSQMRETIGKRFSDLLKESRASQPTTRATSRARATQPSTSKSGGNRRGTKGRSNSAHGGSPARNGSAPSN